MTEAILGEDGVKDAVAGKAVISIMGGILPSKIDEIIYKDSHHSQKASIIRAMPNLGAQVGASMTIIEDNPSLSAEHHAAVMWIFESIGAVKFLDAKVFDAGTLLAGSSMALFSLALDGILDGCVMKGLRRSEAMEMAIQSIHGMTELFHKEHPALLRESISSPGGSTISSLQTLEVAGVRWSFARAMVDGIDHLQN
ncbi:hypothetical protein N7450_010335 [Penicillium hetheringtonii]|uniref:Pyrroline-5-carboxylate reductase dimerisation domain-containing protein n=1 Tax=Penicillium hetheringtonii TaxID=911720 RepID=A0AAD6GPM2_9EURO|nr:hypothetical protein N7450_010335 [Penicillium hetheringtonii]